MSISYLLLSVWWRYTDLRALPVRVQPMKTMCSVSAMYEWQCQSGSDVRIRVTIQKIISSGQCPWSPLFWKLLFVYYESIKRGLKDKTQEMKKKRKKKKKWRESKCSAWIEGKENCTYVHIISGSSRSKFGIRIQIQAPETDPNVGSAGRI
jgi:hypothetical protein